MGISRLRVPCADPVRCGRGERSEGCSEQNLEDVSILGVRDMPDKIRHPCLVPGCSGYADDGTDGYCHGHRADREQYIRKEVDRVKKENETPWTVIRRKERGY